MALSTIGRVFAACAAVVASAADKEKGSFPLPDAVTQFLCKELEIVSVQTNAVDEVCSKVTAVPTPVCEELLKTAWRRLDERCSKTAAIEASIPVLPVVKEFICKELEDATIEGRFADDVCSKVKAIPTPICEEAVKNAWQRLEEKCPKQSSLPEPIEKIIEDLVCEALESGAEEQKITAEVCSKIAEKFKFVPEEICEATLKSAWAELVEKCPKKKTPTLFGPIPKIIEEAICIALESGTEENKITTDVCSKVVSVVKTVPEEACDDMVKAAWEELAKKCPKRETALLAPIEKVIEHYVCKEIESGTEEINIAQDVCDKVTEKSRFFPGSMCEGFVKSTLKKTEEKCPKKEVLYLPEPIEHAIEALEALVCRHIEKLADMPKAVSEACAIVHNHFKDFPVSACADVVEMIFEKAAKTCEAQKPSVLV
mmetsp:Transcript_16069/g.44075  ORF Transcript_16069/g.44075 Transcript_16069/m.44075 type:complete len:428 (-) Transcript_16069:86-1369(-)